MTDPTAGLLSDLLPHLDRHTQALLATVATLTDDDLGADSLCTGWTRGHVLSHIARNADGLTTMLRAALDGTGETMYASVEQRELDIEAGARRPMVDQLADIASSAATLDGALRRLRPEHADLQVERTPGGQRVRIGNVPAMRLREVVYHHADLAAGFGFEDLEPALLHRFTKLEITLWDDAARSGTATGVQLRADDGSTWTAGDGGQLIEGSPGALLAWLARGVTDGVRAGTVPPRPA